MERRDLTPDERGFHRRLDNVPFQLGDYNMYLIGRDGKMICWQVLKNEESERVKALDLAVLENRKIEFDNFSFDVED